MNREEIEEIETLEIDFKDTDELKLALEVSSKKAIYLIDDLIKYLFELQQENQQIKDKANQLETNKDVVFTKEETEKLLKQFQELDKCDTALTSSLMSKRIHLENEILKKKVTQLETNRDEALNLMEKCKFDKTDKYIPISEYKEYQELKSILERSTGGSV